MKTRTYIVRFVKQVYADVTVQVPEEGFSAEFAILTAANDINGMSVTGALQAGAVSSVTDWEFHTVELAMDGEEPRDLLAQFVLP